MKLVSFLFTLVALAGYGQTKTFDLDHLESTEAKTFLHTKKVIVVGEMHGTTEVPQVVFQLVKLLVRENNPVTVGLEINRNYQPDVDDYMKTGDFEKLKKLNYFKFPDGRTSVAMGELITNLRSIKGIRVICFDVDESEMNKNRDSLMGVNLSRSFHDGQLVMLTGNLHASLKEGYWRPQFKSATYYFNKLREFNDQLISLNTYFGSGTIWNCQQDGCKARDVYSDSFLKERTGLTNFISLFPATDGNGYSGFVYVDRVTASKPLVN